MSNTPISLGPTVAPAEPLAPALEAENSVHWLVRMSLSFGAQTSVRDGFGLAWYPQERAIRTHELVGTVQLELLVPTLSFQFHEAGRPSPHLLDVDGKCAAEIEAWLLVEMLHRDFERDHFSKALPYRARALMSGDEPKYEIEDHATELTAIVDSLVAASSMLFAVQRELGVTPKPDGSLCVWPDGFAIGFLTATSDGVADRPVVRVVFALDADGAGNPGFAVARLADSGELSGRRTLADQQPSAAALVALVREVETASRQ